MKFRLFPFLLLSFSLCAQQSVPEPPSEGSVGCWPFDGNAKDYSGKNNHGVASNVVYTYNRFNQPNAAARFNGVNSGVVVPHSASIDFTVGVSFSFTYWQKTYPGNVDAVIITKHTYGKWDGYNFIANNQANGGYCTGTDHMYWYVASGGQQDACSNGPVLADTLWHFIAGVYDAGANVTYLYIDGVKQSDAGKRSGVVANPADLSFGYDADINDLHFNGVLDDACLYPRLLSSSEVLAMYNAGVSAASEYQKPSGTGFTIFPNPSEGQFSVTTTGTEKIELVRIYDQLGQLVKTLDMADSKEMRITDLRDGLYSIAADGGNSRPLVQKLLICR